MTNTYGKKQFKKDMKKLPAKKKYFTLKLSKDDPRYKLLMSNPKTAKLMRKKKS